MDTLLAYALLILVILISGYIGQILAKFKFIKSFKPIFVIWTVVVIGACIWVHTNKWYFYVIAFIFWLLSLGFLNAGFSLQRKKRIKIDKSTTDGIHYQVEEDINNLAEEIGESIGEKIGKL